MSKAMKYIEENSELSQINQRNGKTHRGESKDGCKKMKMQKMFKSLKRSLEAIRKADWLTYYQGITFCISKKHINKIRGICKQIVVNINK